MQLKHLCNICHDMAKDKGWYDNERPVPELLALIHSEVSEALEDYRKNDMETYKDKYGKPCGFPSEVADIVIRIADMCGYMGIDLEEEITTKMEYNKTRSYRHGNKRA